MRESFLKYIQFEKRYSTHTVTSYENDLNQFTTFIDQHFPGTTLEGCSHPVIRNWIVSLMDTGLDPRTINRKIACLRSFYKFLLKREMIEDDPMRKIQALKTSKKLPQFINEKDMNRLLDHVTFEKNFSGARDRLILELLYGTGTRLAEILQLKDVDIDLSQRTLKVLGKRNKERMIPFSISLKTILESYIQVRNANDLQNDEGFLIVTDDGKKCYPMLIYRTVKHYLDLFTTIEKRSPHVLRHTFATHLLNKGAELNAVKDLLGHTSLAATQVYTHNSIEKLKTVFDQAHPKA